MPVTGASNDVSDNVDATLAADLGCPAKQQQAGVAIQQGAAAIACCQTWQVSVTISVRVSVTVAIKTQMPASRLNPVLSDELRVIDFTLCGAFCDGDLRLSCACCCCMSTLLSMLMLSVPVNKVCPRPVTAG